eukprot:9514307-Alexandrium_andersonii.AAC.1
MRRGRGPLQLHEGSCAKPCAETSGSGTSTDSEFWTGALRLVGRRNSGLHALAGRGDLLTRLAPPLSLFTASWPQSFDVVKPCRFARSVLRHSGESGERCSS